MNEVKSKNLFTRVSEKEKKDIERNAEKCGLSVSEYLRREPWDICRKLVFFSFSDKLVPLCIGCEDKITADTQPKLIALIDEITHASIPPTREKQEV